LFRLLPRTALASALLLPGGVANHVVVDRPQPELKTKEDQFPDSGNAGIRILTVERGSPVSEDGVLEALLLKRPVKENH
jgi:hypothetical protein